MSHKIAIITTGCESYDRYSDSFGTIVNSITDWTEVSDDEFHALQSMEYKMGFHVIEQPVYTPAFVRKTVADYQKYVAEEKAKEAAAKAKREQAALDRKLKKELKDTASKAKLLAKLVDELGPEAVQSVINK